MNNQDHNYRNALVTFYKTKDGYIDQYYITFNIDKWLYINYYGWNFHKQYWSQSYVHSVWFTFEHI